MTKTLRVESHEILALLFLCRGWPCETKPLASVKKTSAKKKQGKNDTPEQNMPRKAKRKLEAAFATEDPASGKQDTTEQDTSESEYSETPLFKETIPVNEDETLTVRLDTTVTNEELGSLEQELVVNTLTEIWNSSS